MSHTLPDLATFLPPDFLSGDMDGKPLFLNNHNHVPYDFAYSSSNESESDEDDVTELTRRFTRSVSLQERFKTPYPLETKRGFSGSPESTLNRNISGPARSSPATPFGHRNEDSWDLIYAAAEQIAMMKMKMKMNTVNDGVFANGGLLGAPRPVGAPLSRHYFPQRVAGGASFDCGGRCVTGGPLGFRQSAWPPLPVETQRRQQPTNGGFSGVVKKERAGTGVFLPRSYPNIQPESKNKPAVVAQSLNKNMDPIIAQPQPNIHAGFAPRYEAPPPPPYDLIMARLNAVMLAQQRQSSGRETREIVLPQEWTY